MSRWILFTTLALALSACTTPERTRVRSGAGPGMRSLCQDTALQWTCPESVETASGEAAQRALRR